MMKMITWGNFYPNPFHGSRQGIWGEGGQGGICARFAFGTGFFIEVRACAQKCKNRRKTMGINEPARGNAPECSICGTGDNGARAGRAVLPEVFPASPVYYARSHVAQSFRPQLQQHRWVKLHCNVFHCFLSVGQEPVLAAVERFSTGAKFETHSVRELGLLE